VREADATLIMYIALEKVVTFEEEMLL